MKRMVILAFLLSSGIAIGGEIYGRIVKDGKPVGGLQVTVEVAGVPMTSTTNPKTGNYRVVMSKAGTGTIKLDYKRTPLSAMVTSYKNRSVRYDFRIVLNAQGKYELKRR